MSILIEDAKVLTMGKEENKDGKLELLPPRKASIAIRDSIIEYVGINPPEREYDEYIDGKNILAMPGLVNAHTHAGMSLLRGYADDLPLKKWLEKKVWPLEAKFKPEHVYWGSLLSCLEMLKNGITCFADMYFFMEQTARAAKESGLRASLSMGLTANDPDDIKAWESKVLGGISFAQNWHRAAEGRITTMLGPHSPYTCSPDRLKELVEISKGYRIPMHIHISETYEETEEIMNKYDISPVAKLDTLDFFEGHVLAAHLVAISSLDIDTLAKKYVNVVHNPQSNMKLASGISPVPEMLKKGINVALGTDGVCSNNSLDIFAEMKAAALLHKVNKLDPTVMSASEVLPMGTTNGTIALDLDNVGPIVAGKKADLILIDLDKPNFYPQNNLVSHLVYSATGSDVQTVIVNGKILMKDREVLSLDEEKIMFEAESCFKKLISY